MVLSSFYVSEAALYLEVPAFNPSRVATPLHTAYFWQGGDENVLRLPGMAWGPQEAAVEAAITEC